jgi:tetratricopeptide (TPR) repeat protein
MRALGFISLSVITTFCTSTDAHAKTTAQAIFYVENITDTSLDPHRFSFLERLDGVTFVKWQRVEHTVTVNYDRSLISSKNLEALIKKKAFSVRTLEAPQPPIPTRTHEDDGSILQYLAEIKWDETQQMARDLDLPIAHEYKLFFEQALKDDWTGASNTYHRLLWLGIQGRNSPLWQPLLDTYGAFEQSCAWQSKDLRGYARDMLSQIPSNSIYFGGTDSGRFIVTAYRDVIGKPDAMVLTQNALADNNYMTYVRWRYGDRIWSPSQKDSNEAFEDLMRDVQSGRIEPNAKMRVVDGKLKVDGVEGVMMVNGRLAKMIFEANKDTHAFYVEESYVLPWMYPYLSPCGLIMTINPVLMTNLPSALVAKDRAFWDSLTAKFQKDVDFKRDRTAQSVYAKLRAAIAGLYAYHRLFAEAQYAFEQALELYPLLPEGNFRLTDMYMQQRKYSDAIAAMEKYIRLNSADTRAHEFLDQIRKTEKIEKRRDELEALFTKNEATITNAMELLNIYVDLQIPQQLKGLSYAILEDTNIFATAYLDVANIFAKAGRQNDQVYAMGRYLRRVPSDYQARIDLAALETQLGRTQDALRSLKAAVQYGGHAARDAILVDPRLKRLHDLSEYQDLVLPARIGQTGVMPGLP